MNRPLDAELHALADRRLPERRAAEVRQWLTDHPEEAAHVHAWESQNELLHAHFDPDLEAPVPDRLQRLAARSRYQPAFSAIAASVAWLSIGAMLGFMLRGPSSQPAPAREAAAPSLPVQAAVAHAVYTPEVRHPVEVGADQEAHLVQWLSKRLGSALTVPEFGSQGYRLIGGRLLPGNGGPAAQFMYQDRAGTRLTLYVRRDIGATETAFRFASEDKVSVFYWVDGPFGYALSAELPREQLLAIADTAYRQLNHRAPAP